MEVDDQNDPNFYSLLSRLFFYTLSTVMHSSSNHGRCHIVTFEVTSYATTSCEVALKKHSSVVGLFKRKARSIYLFINGKGVGMQTIELYSRHETPKNKNHALIHPRNALKIKVLGNHESIMR